MNNEIKKSELEVTKQMHKINLDSTLAKSLAYGVVASSFCMFFPEIAFAGIDYIKMAKAGGKPIADLMVFIWPAVIAGGAVCGYMFGQGDFMQRWKPILFGALGGGGVCTGLEYVNSTINWSIG